MAVVRLLVLLVGLFAAAAVAAAERVSVRVGEHPGLSRLIFGWSTAPEVELEPPRPPSGEQVVADKAPPPAAGETSRRNLGDVDAIGSLERRPRRGGAGWLWLVDSSATSWIVVIGLLVVMGVWLASKREREKKASQEGAEATADPEPEHARAE